MATKVTKQPIIPPTKKAPATLTINPNYTGAKDSKYYSNSNIVRNLSIAALSGNKVAQEELKRNNVNAYTGDNLWKGYDPKKLKAGSAVYNQYINDNPMSTYTKAEDLKNYNAFNDIFNNNKGYTNGQLQQYQNLAKKWNLSDVTAPNQMQQGETSAYNNLVDSSNTQSLGLSDAEAKKKYDELLSSAHMQADPLIKNYQDYLGTLNNQQQTDNQNIDMSYNQNANNLYAQQFQQANQANQQMAERGLTDSGIAQDALTRLQMAGNNNLQSAFLQAQQQKVDTAKQFDSQRFNVNGKLADLSPEAMAAKNLDTYKADYLDASQKFQADRNKTLADAYNSLLTSNTSRLNNQNDNQTKMALGQADNQVKMAELQQKYDAKFTDAAGILYANGKPVLGANKKPIQTVDFMKMSETQRHNVATENNITQKNAMDYSLGQQKNEITAQGNQLDYQLGMQKDATQQQKIVVDLQKSIAKNKIEYAKIDLNYKKLESTNTYNQAKIKQAAENAQTKKDGQQLTALGKQAGQITSQITAYQKKGKKPPKELVTKYNKINGQIDKLIGQKDFFKPSKGSDVISKANDGTPSAFGGYRKVSQAPSKFKMHMQDAVYKGVPFKDAKLLTELIGRESSFNPSAANPVSSARGYGQFLSSTRANYAKKYPNLNYNNPVDQIVLTYKYAKEKYGSVQNALHMWESRNPHWY